jgi:hypothetical protein
MSGPTSRFLDGKDAETIAKLTANGPIIRTNGGIV